jgi:hypothetical protein
VNDGERDPQDGEQAYMPCDPPLVWHEWRRVERFATPGAEVRLAIEFEPTPIAVHMLVSSPISGYERTIGFVPTDIVDGKRGVPFLPGPAPQHAG